jgi:hypothetical protein
LRRLIFSSGCTFVVEGNMNSSRLGWPLTIASGFALVLIAFGVWAFWQNYSDHLGVDFVSFWSAGRLALHGNPAAAYDIAIHRGVELGAAPGTGLMPFPYPPPFLLVVTVFAFPSFPFAYALWDVVTGALYAFAGRRIAPLAYVLANPPVLVAAMIGQSSLLTSAILIAGLSLVSSSPFVAGAILGLLIIKPQLALMLPVAMLAGRQWRVIAGAVLSSSTALLLALLVFGSDSYRGFFAILPHYVGYMSEARWDWAELASPFALLRYFGAGQAVALGFQGIICIAAGIITAIAWARDWENKVPVLGATSLLASAYLFTYDAILLILPAAVLIRHWKFWSLGILWLLCLLPTLKGYNAYDGPNTIPLACLFCIVLLVPWRSSDSRMPVEPVARVLRWRRRQECRIEQG